MSPFWLDLPLAVGCDSTTVVTILSPSLAQMGIAAASSAELEFRVTPEDPAPLATVTTTPGASGSLVFGVAFPSPAGASVSNAAGLTAFGPGSTLVTTLPATTQTVATTAGLAALPTIDDDWGAGSSVFVSAGDGAFLLWSPGDTSTPNATTIFAGVGGRWLLAGTVTVNVTALSTQAMLGFERVLFDLVVVLASGERAPLLTGASQVRQTISD